MFTSSSTSTPRFFNSTRNRVAGLLALALIASQSAACDHQAVELDELEALEELDTTANGEDEAQPIQKPGHLTQRALVAATCKTSPSEANCSYRDAQAQGCNTDAYHVAQVVDPTNNLQVNLRYSPSCRSVWTTASDTRFGVRITNARITRSDGATTLASGNGSARSAMLYVGGGSTAATASGQLLTNFLQVIASAQTPYVYF